MTRTYVFVFCVLVGLIVLALWILVLALLSIARKFFR